MYKKNLKFAIFHALVITCVFMISQLPGHLRAEGCLVVRSSSTLAAQADTWGDEFSSKPGGQCVVVSPTQTTKGVDLLFDGKAQVYMASGQDEEHEATADKKRLAAVSKRFVGFDGVTVIINKENPVHEISMYDLKRIFSGRINNWKDIGGPDEPIMVLIRPFPKSETATFFKRKVLGSLDYTKQAEVCEWYSLVLSRVSGNLGAIGYVSLPSAEKALTNGMNLRVAEIRADDLNSTPIAPTRESIFVGVYPLTRPLFMYYFGSNAEAVKFVDFCEKKLNRAVLAFRSQYD
jgi:phosphate transport system substrate-binding protein